jgi:predicted TIM-barrel fold metal-dependent hydrolase
MANSGSQKKTGNKMSALIDTEVRVRWEQDDEIFPWLDKTWHSRWLIGRGGHTAAGLYIQPKFYDPDNPDPMPTARVPGLSTVNLHAAPNVQELASQWLNPHGIQAAVISCFDAPLISTYGDRDYPTEVAHAVNQWLVHKFLNADSRLYGSITVATQKPEEAAREIRRAAEHPRMVQVVLPTGARMPYGHDYYRPIFRAAYDCGLSIAIQAGTEGLGTSNPPTPSGWPGTVAEMRVARINAFMAHLTSMITEGIFTEYPNLTVIGMQTGVAWLPPYLWRFDKNWKALRSEAPWLTLPPSEIATRHFRFTTSCNAPVEPAEEFWRLIRSIPNGLQWLIYGSNYPRWDMDSPNDSFVLNNAPAEIQSWIRSEGALSAYPRLHSPTVVG